MPVGDNYSAFRVGDEYERQGKGFLDNPYPDGTTPARRYVDDYVQSMQDRWEGEGGR